MTDRLSRLAYALALVDVIKLRAACTRRQVGAVVLDQHGRITGTGYNGTPAGATHCTDGGCPRGAFGYDEIPGFLGNTGHPVVCTALHAETNATEQALATYATRADPWDLHRSSLVAISCPPCPDCERRLKADKWGAVAFTSPESPDGIGGWGDWRPWAAADAPHRIIVG